MDGSGQVTFSFMGKMLLFYVASTKVVVAGIQMLTLTTCTCGQFGGACSPSSPHHCGVAGCGSFGPRSLCHLFSGKMAEAEPPSVVSTVP